MVAYGVVEYAKKLSIEAKVVYLFDDYAQPDFNRLKNKQGNGSCSHAVVCIDDCMYDSNGEFSPESYFGNRNTVTRLELSQEQVKESINYRKHWNKRFDRRAGKKQIQKILGIPIKIKQKLSE